MEQPIDKGWSWVVLAGAVLNGILTMGQFRSTGILLIEIQEYYHASASVSTLLFTVGNVMGLISPPIYAVLIEHLSLRTLMIIGNLLHTISLIAGSMAPNIYVFIVLRGVLAGMAAVITYQTPHAALGQYFRDKVILATSIISAGASIGPLIIPHVYAYIFENYSVQGGLLLLAAIPLHGLIGTMTFRPASYYGAEVDSLEMIKKVEQQIRRKSLALLEKDNQNKRNLGSINVAYIADEKLNPPEIIICDDDLSEKENEESKDCDSMRDTTIPVDIDQRSGQARDGNGMQDEGLEMSKQPEGRVEENDQLPSPENSNNDSSLAEANSTEIGEHSENDENKKEQPGSVKEEQTEKLPVINIMETLEVKPILRRASMPNLSVEQSNDCDSKNRLDITTGESEGKPYVRRVSFQDNMLNDSELHTESEHSKSEIILDVQNISTNDLNNKSSNGIEVDHAEKKRAILSVIDRSSARRPSIVVSTRILFKQKSFPLLILSRTISQIGYVLTVSFLPLFMLSTGMNISETATLIMIIGICEIPTRFFHGWFSSKHWINPCVHSGVLSIAASVLIVVGTLLASYIGTLVIAISVGTLLNAHITLHTIIIRQGAGIKMFSLALSITSMSICLPSIPLPYIFGWIFDITGSYAIQLLICAGLIFIGNILTLVEYFLRKKQQTKL